MIGTLLNAVGIIVGGLAGSWSDRQLSPQRQRQVQVLLGAFTVFFGLSIVWSGLRGSFPQFLGRFALMLVALMLGKLTGHALRIQRRVNRAGRFATTQLTPDQAVSDRKFSDVFAACTAVYCLAPLALLGSLAEGMHGDIRPLIIKTIMDGLAAMAFARIFPGAVLLSAVPVFVWQGTLTLGTRFLLPVLEASSLVDSLSATAGMLIFAVALVILRLRRIELADYWPSLLYAPLLTMLFR